MPLRRTFLSFNLQCTCLRTASIRCPNFALYLLRNNGMSIRKATINWGSTSTVSYSRNPVPNLNDVSDFTQINNFFIAEITSAHQGTNGGFNETSMLLSSDGVTFSAAQVAVGPTELVESFEVVQASAGQVGNRGMLACRQLAFDSPWHMSGHPRCATFDCSSAR